MGSSHAQWHRSSRGFDPCFSALGVLHSDPPPSIPRGGSVGLSMVNHFNQEKRGNIGRYANKSQQQLFVWDSLLYHLLTISSKNMDLRRAMWVSQSYANAENSTWQKFHGASTWFGSIVTWGWNLQPLQHLICLNMFSEVDLYALLHSCLCNIAEDGPFLRCFRFHFKGLFGMRARLDVADTDGSKVLKAWPDGHWRRLMLMNIGIVWALLWFTN